MFKVKIAGIYKISIGEYYYIGKSVDLFSRLSTGHIPLLVIGKHHSPELQEAFNEFGLTSLRFEILEVISLSGFKKETGLKGKALDKEFNRLLLDKEKEWMGKHSINFCLNKDKKYFK